MEFRLKEADKMFDLTLHMLEKEKDENNKKLLLSHLISVAFSHKNKMLLAQWLEKGCTIPGCVLQRVQL